MIELSTYIAVFVIASGLMAMVEAAILSVRPAEVEAMAGQGQWGASLLLKVNRRLTRSLVVIVIVTNTINILGPLLIGQLATRIYGNTAIGVITAVLTFATIVFSEIIPKSIGSHYAPTISRVVAPIIWGFSKAIFPIVLVLEWITTHFQKGERKVGTEEQIRSLVRLGRRRGYIEKDEGRMIYRTFMLNDSKAGDIMTPAADVVTIDSEKTAADAKNIVADHGFSRFPVVDHSSGAPMGMVLAKDLLHVTPDAKVNQEPLLHPVLTLPPSIPCDELMMKFRSESMHLAVVADRDRMVGIVTLEDVLEELVGEIDDEKD